MKERLKVIMRFRRRSSEGEAWKRTNKPVWERGKRRRTNRGRERKDRKELRRETAFLTPSRVPAGVQKATPRQHAHPRGHTWRDSYL